MPNQCSTHVIYIYSCGVSYLLFFGYKSENLVFPTIMKKTWYFLKNLVFLLNLKIWCFLPFQDNKYDIQHWIYQQLDAIYIITITIKGVFPWLRLPGRGTSHWNPQREWPNDVMMTIRTLIFGQDVPILSEYVLQWFQPRKFISVCINLHFFLFASHWGMVNSTNEWALH